MNTKTIILLFTIILAFMSCNTKKPLDWDNDVVNLTNKNLKGWLQKAPFNNEWVIDNNDNSYVFTNLEQVFPFMGKFNDFKKDTSKEHANVYEEETVVFKDTLWGESFMYGMLLYQPTELFLKDYYSERGNIIFSGVNASNEVYTANLSETFLYEKNTKYKAAVYWVSCGYKTYLFGFYQQGKLVFEFGFPCKKDNQLEGLEKLKQINTALGLDIKQWENATINDLQINRHPKSFK
ncbi:hypothetical protein MK851_12425 [Tenacibaculum sp. 1B UA]|uniref:hypothetical protein n=1 Tax=unclassified Tenacibaculum TaxID=2635139 RepID=UPI0026E13F73|nr:MULTISPECIES: hypothetical protein [unclassified Tenacibaculum]MDO6675021.1 hypothetical protein [Tenacibaculum sp. 1_MG-2023]MDX8554424.1 hypothetical protein [Tenacibaculum sp. 1B UA]